MVPPDVPVGTGPDFQVVGPAPGETAKLETPQPRISPAEPVRISDFQVFTPPSRQPHLWPAKFPYCIETHGNASRGQFFRVSTPGVLKN